jgi:hypothetical protein
MTKEPLVVFIAIYENVDDALVDLEDIEVEHKDDFVGLFDAAIVDRKKGRLHVVKRMDRPFAHVIPEDLGFGPLSRPELKEAAAQLSSDQVALIVIGQPTLEAAFDKAVTKATKVVKSSVNATPEEIANDMKEAAGG